MSNRMITYHSVRRLSTGEAPPLAHGRAGADYCGAMSHAFYASPFGHLDVPMIFAPLAVVWFVGRHNLVGKTIHRWLPGTALFWLGEMVLVSLTVFGLYGLAAAFITPTPAILVSSADVTCRFDSGPITLPWRFVTQLRAEVENGTRRGATVHRHFAVFQLDPLYIDHLPWDNYARRTRTAACGLDALDAPPGAIYRTMAQSWRTAGG
jgi:hypothetical protein